jgi:hypothetical protein
MASVILLTDAGGAVVTVLDGTTRKPLAFETEEDADEEAHRTECAKLLDLSAEDSPARGFAWGAFEAHVLAYVALPNATVERQLPTGTAYLLPSVAVPPADSFFPLELAYADGVSIVELETNVRNSGLALTESFFAAPEFRRQLAEAARSALRAEPQRGHAPGLLTREMHDHLLPYTSPAYPDDPHLRKWHADPFAVWEPQLGRGDFAGIFKSTWDKVNPNTKAMLGHADGQVHFYAAVGWSLPEEMADQVAHVVKANPGGRPWAKLIERGEFAKAEELSRKSRGRLLTRLMQSCGLELKARTKPCPWACMAF